jgi:hypothetical protein
VGHELVTLPFYTVFDDLTYSVNGGTVTLMGQVTRPALKSDAEKAVRQIAGVRSVNDEIEVLPVSAADGKIRLAEYLAIYGVKPVRDASDTADSYYREKCHGDIGRNRGERPG